MLTKELRLPDDQTGEPRDHEGKLMADKHTTPARYPRGSVIRIPRP